MSRRQLMWLDWLLWAATSALMFVAVSAVDGWATAGVIAVYFAAIAMKSILVGTLRADIGAGVR